MIKFALSIYILVLSFGALSAFFTFIFDVLKWHKAEKREQIKSSYESYYMLGGVSLGGTGNSGTGTGTGNDNNDKSTSPDNNNDNERTNSDIQFSL